MSNSLENKIAIITGGTSGIGLAIAKRFVSEGAFVFITGRGQKQLDAAVAEIGSNAKGIQADSSNLEDLDRVYAEIKGDKNSKGRIDIVVANAGILEKAPIAEVSEGMFDRLFGINVKGLVFTVQKALPLMPDGSAIILMSSTVANKGLGGNSLYAATKAAIRNFARGWTTDLKSRKIRVNSISPGPIDTPGLASAYTDPAVAAATLAYMAGQVPLGRLGAADEIAKVAVFLASDAASYMTGADVQVDGGWIQV